MDRGLEPLRNPQEVCLGRSFGGYQKVLSHLQRSRRQIQRFASYCKQAKIFCCVFCRAIRATEMGGKSFCLAVSAVFFKPRLQALKLLIFAPRSGKIHFAVARCGFPKGSRPFGALLPPLLGARQEVAIVPSPSARSWARL